MATKVMVQGFKELDDALRELPRATERNTLRRAAIAALKPFLAAVKAKAPVDENVENTPERPPGTLKNSYHIGTRLNKTQARSVRKLGKSGVEVYAGTSDPLGVPTEFGTAPRTIRKGPRAGQSTGAVPAQPHARPAWDETSSKVVVELKEELGKEIAKAAKRLAKKRGKA